MRGVDNRAVGIALDAVDFQFALAGQFEGEVAAFADEQVAPVAAEHDEAKTFPYELVAQMGELGLFGLPFPEVSTGYGIVNEAADDYDPLQKFLEVFADVTVQKEEKEDRSGWPVGERLHHRIIDGDREGLTDDLDLAPEIRKRRRRKNCFRDRLHAALLFSHPPRRQRGQSARQQSGCQHWKSAGRY